MQYSLNLNADNYDKTENECCMEDAWDPENRAEIQFLDNVSGEKLSEVEVMLHDVYLRLRLPQGM